MSAAHTTQFWRSRHTCRRPAAFAAALVVYIIVILAATPQAQQPPAFASGGATATPAVRDAASGSVIDLLVGRSTVLNIGSTIARVSLTVPDIADAMVTAPAQLLIHGKQPGTISLFVWDKSGSIKTYEVTVRRDLSALNEHLRKLFPGEDITVLGSGTDVVLSGTVASEYVVEKAADVAAGYVDKKENVVNLLKQQEGVASNQVMLRVRFAEVSRSALQELGASFFTGPGGFRDYVSRVTTQQFPANHYDEMIRESTQGPDNWGGGRDTVTATGGKHTFSDLLNLFIFNNRYNIGTVIRALSEKGLFQSLAEPNLIATNGKEASFLAGGEYPYPIVQPSAGNTSVTITFKEFGIRLSFTPTVLGGDLINLKVRPEVSALDFSNAITLQGFRIPALSTRRTETEVELRDGQTFAIAGLMNNTVTDSMRKIPGIGDIPILGWLFKSKAMAKNQTELVVMITPTIIRRGQMGVSEGLPSLVEPYMGPPQRTVPNPDPWLGSPRYPPTHAPGRDDSATPAPVPNATTTPAWGPEIPASRPMVEPTPTPAPEPAQMSDMPPAAVPPLPSAPIGFGPPIGAPPADVPPQMLLQTAPPAQPEPRPPDAGPPVGPVPPPGSPATPASEPAFMPHPGSPLLGPVPVSSPHAPPPPGAWPGGAPVDTAVEVAPSSRPLTKKEIKAIEKAREQERKAAEAEARRRAAEQNHEGDQAADQAEAETAKGGTDDEPTPSVW